MADQRPNWCWLKPSHAPIGGKIKSAMEFRTNMVQSATDIAAGSARITLPTAAMALPPQIDVPEAISREAFDSTFKSFPNRQPIRSVPKIDNAVIPKPSRPFAHSAERFMPNPKPTTDSWSRCFESFWMIRRSRVSNAAAKRSPKLKAAGGETLPERQAAPRVRKTKIGTVSSLVEIGAGDL